MKGERMSSHSFKKGFLASSIALALGSGLSMPLYAAEDDANKADDDEEIIVVVGIRDTLKANLSQKRNANAHQKCTAVESAHHTNAS